MPRDLFDEAGIAPTPDASAPAAPRDLIAESGLAPISSSIWPLTQDAPGQWPHFDSNAGLLGTIKRALMAPGDVYAGRLDPNSEEGRQRAFDLASMFTPANPAVRAGDYAIPGLAKNLVPPKPPTIGALNNATDAAYDVVRATGAQYPGEAVGSLARDTISGLNNDGFIATNAPKTHAILNDLANPPDGSFATITGLDSARRALNKISGDRTDQAAARQGVAAIDDFIQKAGTAPPMAGPPTAAGEGAPNLSGLNGLTPEAEAARLIQQARGNAAAAFRSDRITGAEDAAERQAAVANSGHNIGNALRQRLNSILNNPQQSRGFSQDELDAIRQVVEGTASSNTLRLVSNKLAGGGGIWSTILSGIGAAIGAHLGGPEWAAAGVAIPHVVGPAVRNAYNSTVSRQIADLDELIRSRSPLYQQTPWVPGSPAWPLTLRRSGLLSNSSAQQNPDGLLGPIPGQ